MKLEKFIKLHAPADDLDIISKDRRGLYDAAMSYLNQAEDSKNDYKAAYPLLKEAAKKKDLFAIAELGWFYLNGYHVKKDLSKAHELIRYTFERGNSKGAYYFGVIHRKGKGAQTNYIKAIEIFNVSATYALREMKLGENRGKDFLTQIIKLKDKEIKKLYELYKNDPVCDICFVNIWEQVFMEDSMNAPFIRLSLPPDANPPELYKRPTANSILFKEGHYCPFCQKNYIDKIEEAYEQSILSKHDIEALAKRDDLFEALQPLRIHWMKRLRKSSHYKSLLKTF